MLIKMKKLMIIISTIFLFSCSPTKSVLESANIDKKFTMDNNVVYIDGNKYATLESINYGIVNSEEVYEVIFILDTNADQSLSRDFINHVVNIRPDWVVKVQNNFKNIQANK
jgi:predicted alpha/beta superfamily hydrolase